VESSDEQRAAFAAALLRQLDGRDRVDVRRRVHEICGESVSKAALQQWLAGTSEPTRAKLVALEQIFELAPGALSRHLGFVPASAVPAVDVIDAIRSDTALSAKSRERLVLLYRSEREG
jgi:hypothetical protein